MPGNTNANTFVKDPRAFLHGALTATSSKAIKDLLAQLPIVAENDYTFDEDAPQKGWQEGQLHWFPVGRDRGNAGRIKLAGNPENPIAERTINGMEALIERERHLELLANPNAPQPETPRDAVMRYFGLPPLHELPGWVKPIRGEKAKDYARDIARKLRIRLVRAIRP